MAVSMALCSATALAQNMGFTRDSAISFMNKDDMAMLTSNYTQALESLPDGHTNTWSNPKSGHSGTAAPTKSFKENGMACRQLEMTNTAGGQTGRSDLVFCKAKGAWKLVR